MTAPAHLTAEQISALLAGALPAAEAMELNAQLATCAQCQQLRDDLLAVIAMLADEGAVAVAMPDDVADSLDVALRRASTERAAADPMPEPVRLESAPAATGRRPWRWLAGAAAAAVVVSLGVAGLKALPTQGGSSADDASAGRPPAKSAHGSAGIPEAGSPSGVGGGQSFDRNSVDSINAAQVPAQAQRLASQPDVRSESAYRLSALGCAEPITGGPSIVIQYKGRLAVLTIDRITRGVTVYDCPKGTRVLFSGDY